MTDLNPVKKIGQRDFEIEYFKTSDPGGGSVFSRPEEPEHASLWEPIEVGKPITIFDYSNGKSSSKVISTNVLVIKQLREKTFHVKTQGYYFIVIIF